MLHRKEHPQRDATNVEGISKEIAVNLLGLRSQPKHRSVARWKNRLHIFLYLIIPLIFTVPPE